jgi:protein TonB
MGNAEKAILSSLLVHALLVAVFAFFADRADAPRAVAMLEVAPVELSLSDDPDPERRILRESSPSGAGRPQKLSPGQEPSPAMRHVPRGTPPEPSLPEVPLAGEPVVEMRIENAGGDAAEEQPAAEQAQVVSPARLKQSIKPEYPRQARRRGEEGKVRLSVAVDVNGFVTGVSVALSSGFESLDAAAVKAVRAARFLPARSNDEPVGSNVSLTLVFRLR